MTDEELRIKVAELCGWKPEIDASDPDCVCTSWYAPEGVSAARACAPSLGHLPNYPNDLNAMHEAENQIPDRQKSNYYLMLALVTGPDGWPESATARQRAQAFVKTMENQEGVQA